MAVGDACVFPGFLTPVLTQLFFPKPPTTFLTCFCRGKRLQSIAIKRNLKINNSWPESFNFQNSFNCHWLEFLRTTPLPIHKVIIITIFSDGMNGIYLYFVNKHLSRWPLLGLLMIFIYIWQVALPEDFKSINMTCIQGAQSVIINEIIRQIWVLIWELGAWCICTSVY